MIANTDPDTDLLIELIAEAIRPYVRSAAAEIDDDTAVTLAATDAVRALDRLLLDEEPLALSASFDDARISGVPARHLADDIAASLERESTFYGSRGGWSLRLEQ